MSDVNNPLTGVRFDGREAGRIGLVHQVCEDAAALEAALAKLLADIGRCAPGANAATKRLLLASRTTPLPELRDVGYITSDDALELPKLPKSMIVLGGGAIGCEFAQFMSRFGTSTRTLAVRVAGSSRGSM